jgi:acetoin utilization protein AcuC
MTKLHISYDDVYLDWKLGSSDFEHPTNPVRAKYATQMLQENHDVVIIKPDILDTDRAHVESIHDKEYVSKVLDLGHCGEWRPDDTHKGKVALHMFAGTVRLTEKMLAGDLKVGFNPQGAKHHAQRNHSSGFCVFNDMAWAAKEFHRNGMKVMYIDWDAHHGDGVENLLASSRDIVTCSIHDSVIFPGTGLDGHKPSFGIYNWALDPGSGDDAFRDAVDQVAELSHKIQPDVVLLATGADAHISDPLSTLNFDYPGYKYAAKVVGQIANTYSQGRVLIGGAGGYQPFDHTPQIWSEVVGTVYEEVRLFSWV